jgi:hypothetical protein
MFSREVTCDGSFEELKAVTNNILLVVGKEAAIGLDS